MVKTCLLYTSMSIFRRKKQTDAETESLKSFLDMIAPSIVKFETGYYICGNTFRCIWALREYPTSTDDLAILRHLGEKHGVTLHIYTRMVSVSYTHLDVYKRQAGCRALSCFSRILLGFCMRLASWSRARNAGWNTRPAEQM